MTGLGALAQLDLDQLNLRIFCLFYESGRRELTCVVTAAEVTRADLPTQISTALQADFGPMNTTGPSLPEDHQRAS